MNKILVGLIGPLVFVGIKLLEFSTTKEKVVFMIFIVIAWILGLIGGFVADKN